MGILDWADARGLDPIVDRPIRVLGIDLGTTNSVVTDIVWDPSVGGEPSVTVLEIPQRTRQGGVDGEVVRELLPSVVALVDGVELIGEGAHRLRSDLHDAGLKANASIWWEQKNWMGTNKVHPTAPPGYRTPKEIATRILAHLMGTAEDEGELPIDGVVITVPASFQVTQRADTLDAAAAAGIELAGGDLLDEPVAAFLDYFSHKGFDALPGSTRSRVMVVDFGGGTSDVALLQVDRSGESVKVARRTVSRFHRIGGGDLDVAIANEVLLPALLEEHGIGAFEFNFKQKRDYILPALSSLAEKLKIKLSQEMSRLESLGKLPEDPSDLEVGLPTPFSFSTGHTEHPTLSLAKPRLSVAQLRRATDPFLNRRAAAPLGKEYYVISSIFAPIDDALDAAEWKPEYVDAVLLVGGSGSAVAVREAIRDAFPDATLFTYADALDAQRSISRGAAIRALHRAAFGIDPIEAVLAEDLAILTDVGATVVVPAGTSLPFPAEGEMHVFEGLEVPESRSTGILELRFEFESGGRRLHSQLLALRAPLREGAPMRLNVRITADQVIDLSLVVPGETGGDQVFGAVSLDNPFAVTANPNADREEILRLEHAVLTAGEAERRRLTLQIADLHRGLREYERSRQLMEGLLRSAGPQESLRLLNLLGLVCEAMGDDAARIDYLKQAVSHGDRRVAGFNLAIALKQRRRFAEALEAIDDNIKAEDDAPARSLRASILRDLGQDADADEEYRSALEMSDDARTSSTEFELGWARSAAWSLGRKDVVSRIDQQLKELRSSGKVNESTGGGDGGYWPKASGGAD